MGIALGYHFSRLNRETKHLNLELEEKNINLKRLDKLKDEFLANTSHELRTPLNGINGLAESLLDGVAGKLNKLQESNIQIIASCGRRLAFLVNDILDFTKLKKDKIHLLKKPVDVRSAVDVVYNILNKLILNTNLTFINDVDKRTPPVLVDENRLSQILQNLIGNAIKFTNEGYIKVSTEIYNPEDNSSEGNLLNLSPKYLRISIHDTGIGIPENKFEEIFKSFEQVNGTIEREYGGTGLGLAITKSLIELHEGKIWIESKLHNGTSFHFTLPIADKYVKSDILDSERLSSINVNDVTRIEETPRRKINLGPIGKERRKGLLDRREKIISGDLKNIKALIVDDEPVNLQVINNNLAIMGCHIETAGSGSEALEKLNHGYIPDIILLDIMMPKMNGYECCRKIRELFTISQLPIIFLTAKNQVSDLVEGFLIGANDYITKPFSKNELLSRIKTHLKLSKINSATARFVPDEFLKFLKKESITDIGLGDQVQKNMTILFSDIRSYTTLSESMTPKDNFDFLNGFHRRIGPIIRKHNGFINQYYGDGLMALFTDDADDALSASIEMQRGVAEYNFCRSGKGRKQIKIGIGMHNGKLILGMLGDEMRMDGGVVSDAVNTASRMEGLTKKYGASIIISSNTFKKLNDPTNYNYRILDLVKVKGKNEPVSVFEVFDGNDERDIEIKKNTMRDFHNGVSLYWKKNFQKAKVKFKNVLNKNSNDKAASFYIQRCDYYDKNNLPPDWEGVETLLSK
jgi:two-component system sensor histidine kinase ChiS